MKLSTSILGLLGSSTTVRAYEFDVFLQGGEDNVYTWRDAKNFCMSLKDGWQLAIIDSGDKQAAVHQAFVDAGASADDAAWIGYMNVDGWGANSANSFETLDLYGNRAKFTNYDANEPNNKYGNPKEERGEDCVKMKFTGKWEDALCGRRHTVKAKRGRAATLNSFICEPKPLEDVGECVAMAVAPTSDNYEVFPAETISFPAARQACQSKGPQWDLVVFESDEELAYVKKLINCLPEAFWIGYRENNGRAVDVLGKPATIQMPWEVNKADGSPDEPNDQNGAEECVRMRHGLMNDSQCTKQFSGTMRENLGMGYVCERHANLIPTTAPQVTTDAAKFSTCEENAWGIEPFKVSAGCRAPEYCETSIEIIDAWTRVIDKRTKTKRYGLAAKISVSATLLSKARGQGYSILLRFPKELTKASFQVWNINFFNFYNGGTEVLLHSKYFNQDNSGFDPESNSFILIADNMDFKAHPTVVAFTGRQSKHQCFDPSMHMGSRSSMAQGDSAIRALAKAEYEGDINLDNVQKIRMSKGQLKQVKATGKRRNRF